MALKTELFDFSISTIRPSIGRVAINLNLWRTTDNTITDDPIDTHQFIEEPVKTYVKGETPESLAARWRGKMKDQVNGYIEQMQTEQTKIDNVTSVWTTEALSIDDDIITAKVG